jgi:hypothetical protein
MTEVRLIVKYSKSGGMDVRLGGLTEEQADRIVKTFQQVFEEKYPGRRG